MRRPLTRLAIALTCPLLAGCFVRPVLTPVTLDDGACRASLGAFQRLPLPGVRAEATDGQDLYTLGEDGKIRVSDLDGRRARVLLSGVNLPAVYTAWLAVDGTHIYLVAEQGQDASDRVMRLERLPRSGGKPEAGMKGESVRGLAADAAGVLLLTNRGLWLIDRARWGQGRLLVEGDFASVAVDERHAYLRALESLEDSLRLVREEPGRNTCVAPTSRRILHVDRATGGVALFYRAEFNLQGPVRLDANAVYIAAAAKLPGRCEVRNLLRIPRDGSAAVVLELGGLGDDLAVSPSGIAWIEHSSSRVFRTTTTGGAVMVGYLPCLAQRLSVVAGQVHAFGGTPDACPIFAAPEGTSHARVVAFLPGGPAHLLAQDAGSSYLTLDGQLVRIETADGRRQIIQTPSGEPLHADEAAIVGSTLIIGNHDGLTRWSGDRVTVLREGSAQELSPDGDQLYFVSGDKIHVVRNEGATAVAQALVHSLGADDGTLVWSGLRPGAGMSHPNLWRLGAEGVPIPLATIDGLDRVAIHRGQIFYSTVGRRRPMSSDFAPLASAVYVYGSTSLKLADDQEGVTDLTAGRSGVYWRQRHGVRWADQQGHLRAVDCVNDLGATGIREVGGRLYWTDGWVGALLTYSP